VPSSNTNDCFSEFIGQKVVGVLFDALPPLIRRGEYSTRTLIFEDGRGLTIASNGSFWIDNAEAVARAVKRTRRHLEATQNQLAGVVALATGSSEERP
jgi:hypothetical protein